MSFEELQTAYIKELNKQGLTINILPLPNPANNRYTIKEAAKIMGKAEGTLYNLINNKNGKGLGNVKDGGTIWIYQSDIDAYFSGKTKRKTKADHEADAETHLTLERCK